MIGSSFGNGIGTIGIGCKILGAVSSTGKR